MQAQFRQGDVFLCQIESLPKEAAEQKGLDKIVLAYGEATGHSHSVSSTDARFYNRGDEDYLVVKTKAEVVHEEHDTITLLAGVYKVIRQREYEPIRGSEYVSD